MLILRLYRQDDPFREIDARLLADGDLAIGRDPGAGWTIDDPDCELSRVHCALNLSGATLTLRDTSTNGVFLGEETERLVPGTPVVLRSGESFRLGCFLVFVDTARQDDRPAGESASFAMPAPQPEAAETMPTPTRRRVERRASAPGLANIGAILDAFCAGAQIDPSTLAGEDPAALAERIGAIYRAAVTGLSALMHERTVARSGHEMDRTTVGAADNNPFKWAPSQRVALDLLRPRDGMFLSGQAAIEASFTDLRKHLLCVEAAASGALEATLDALAPARIEQELEGRSFVLRNRAGEAWRQYKDVHADFTAKGHGSDGGSVGAAFRDAYQRRLGELEKDG